MSLNRLWPDPSEYSHYRDEGCKVAPSCLRCPLPRCVHDEPEQRQLKRVRDDELKRRYKRGEPLDSLTRRFSLSRRSVYRIVKEGR